MTGFLFFLVIIFLSLSLSLLLMAVKDLLKIQRIIPKIINDPTREHLTPKMLESASPLVRRLYLNIFDLVEHLKKSSKQQKIRSFDMQKLLDSMKEGVLAVQSSGKVLYHNKALLEILNLDSNQASESKFVFNLNLPNVLQKLIEDRKTDMKVYETTLKIESYDQSKYFWCKTSPLENWHNDKIGILVVLHDITRSKLDEIATREFTANVSHQLRTPLTMVKGYIETLLDEDLSDSHRNYLKIVEKHSNQLHQVVDELMTLASFNDPSVHLDLEPLNLNQILDDALKSAIPFAEQKNVSLETAFNPKENHKILANRVLLTQAFFNLIENAVKFSPENSQVQLSVQQPSITDYVVLIEDWGPGIPATEHEKIFQRFYRGQTTASHTRGSGLGLAIVKHIVKAHRGEVSVQTPKNHSGSCFVVRIPRLND